MTATGTTATSTALTTTVPVFTGPERPALAGFLAGYTGLTRRGLHVGLAPVRDMRPTAPSPPASPTPYAQGGIPGTRDARTAVRRSSSGLHDALTEWSRSDIMGGYCATYCCATPFGTSVLSPRQDVVR